MHLIAIFFFNKYMQKSVTLGSLYSFFNSVEMAALCSFTLLDASAGLAAGIRADFRHCNRAYSICLVDE
jgi:hypothetical protein